MRVLVIGGTGTIGSAVASELSKRHTVITASREQSELKVDITNPSSIESMYQAVGKIDAVVSTTGSVHFGPLTEMTNENFFVGLKSKLMGQINLVLFGLKHMSDNGSFTLTSGILNRDPIRLGASAAMVNGALDGFIKSAALEMPRGMRINCVSPTVITESLDDYADFFREYPSVSADTAAQAYCKSVEGAQTGQVYCV